MICSTCGRKTRHLEFSEMERERPPCRFEREMMRRGHPVTCRKHRAIICRVCKRKEDGRRWVPFRALQAIGLY